MNMVNVGLQKYEMLSHLVWVVWNARCRDGFEEFGCWELGCESVHVLIDQGGQGDALLVEVEDHEHVLPSLVHLLDVVHRRDLPHVAVSIIFRFE